MASICGVGILSQPSVLHMLYLFEIPSDTAAIIISSLWRRKLMPRELKK